MLTVKYVTASSLRELEHILNTSYLRDGYGLVGSAWKDTDNAVYVQTVSRVTFNRSTTVSIEPLVLNKETKLKVAELLDKTMGETISRVQ